MIEYYIVCRSFDVYKQETQMHETKREDIGLLAYDTDSDLYSMYIDKDLVTDSLPDHLSAVVGDKPPTDRVIRDWINFRTIPEAQAGLEYIIRGLGLSEYDSWEIVKKIHGRDPRHDNWEIYITDTPNVAWVEKLTWER